MLGLTDDLTAIPTNTTAALSGKERPAPSENSQVQHFKMLPLQLTLSSF